MWLWPGREKGKLYVCGEIISQKSLLSFFIHNLVNRDSIDDIKREDSSSNWSIQKLDFPLIYSNRTATMWRQWMCVPTPNCANWSKTQPTSSCTWLWITLPLRCPSYGKSHVHTTHIMPQNHVGVCGLVVTSNSHLAISQVHELSSQNVHMVPTKINYCRTIAQLRNPRCTALCLLEGFRFFI